MGKELERKIGENSGNLDTGNTEHAAGSTGNSGTGTAETGTDRGNGKGTGSTEEKKPLGVFPLNESAPPTPEPPKKKQPRKNKEKKPVKNENGFSAEQISALIVASGAIIGSREGFEMFIISEAEAMQISKPLSNIISNSEKLSALGEHADAFALISACFMIFVPRLILFGEARKAKRKQKEGVKIVRAEKPVDGGNREAIRKSTDAAKTHVDGISAAIPSIM